MYKASYYVDMCHSNMYFLYEYYTHIVFFIFYNMSNTL